MTAGPTTQDFIEALCGRFPEDVEDLRAAYEVLRQERVSSVERLARLGDSQWARLGVPLGIESLLRDEAALALQPLAGGAPAAGPSQAAACEGSPRPADVAAGAAANGAAAAEPAAAVAAAAGAAAAGAAAAGAAAAAPSAGAGASAAGPRRTAEQAAVRGASGAPGAAGAHGAHRAAAAAAAAPAGAGAGDSDEGSDDGALPLEPLDFESREGLYRRGRGGTGGASRVAQPRSGQQPSAAASRPRQGGRGAGPSSLSLPQDVEQMWQKLLEDTLTLDKRIALQKVWDNTPDPHDRYMMLLEYSSYLRKPEPSAAERAANQKSFEPLMREFGMQNSDFDEESSPERPMSPTAFLAVSAAALVAGLVYWSYGPFELPHDMWSF